MKFSNPKALTTRLLVALTLAVVSVAGLSGFAEAATCFTCHAPVGSSTDIRPVESTWRNITTGSIKGSHAKHIKAATTSALDCVACHTGANGYTTNHTNALIDVQAGGYTKGVQFAQSGNPVLGSCSTAICHVTSYNTSYVPTPTWGVTTGCVGCHTGVGAFTGAGQSPNTGSHTKHLAASAVCGSCHAGAVAGSSGGTVHVDGNIDVTTGYTANVTKHTQGSGYSTCSNAGAAACHVSAYGTSGVTTTAWGTPGCAACHSLAGAFTGTGSAPVTGSHTKHMAAGGTTCASCHTGAVSGASGGTAHRDGNVDVIGYTANVTKHAIGTNYARCSTASCHADPYSTNGFTVSPTWGIATTCGECHIGVGAFTASGSAPITGSHTKHMAPAVGASCGSCHAGAISGSSGGNAHTDGNIDVIGYTANVTKHAANSGYSRCSSASCHVDPYSTNGFTTSPTWGIATTCGECHVGIGAFTASGSAPVTGAHTKHVAAGATCIQCHAGAITGISGGVAHIDGNIDVTGVEAAGYTANVTKHATGAYVGTCTTTCHTSPYLTSAGTSPEWDAASAGCGLCHSGIGALTASNGPATGSHTKHMAAAVGGTCGGCHAGAIPAVTGGATHNDTHVDVIGGYPLAVTKHAANSGYAKCATATCHANPFSTFGSITTPTWGIVTLCGECHTGIGAFSGTSTSPVTGSHTKHQALSAACGSCHAGAVAGTSGGTAHIDGNIDVLGGYTANVTKHAANSGYGKCSNASCHSDAYDTTPVDSPTWGVSGAGCANCHTGVGAFTGAGLVPTTGSHTRHQASGAVCNQCHANAIAGSTGGAGHNDTNVDVIGGYPVNVTKHLSGSGYSKCSSASCHANPYSTTGFLTSPTWGIVSTCGECHLGIGAFTAAGGVPVTGKHTKHQAGGATCGQCHAGAVAGSSGGTAHTDGNIDVLLGYTPNVTKHAANSTFAGTCTTVCHVSPYTTSAGTSPSWGAASTGCALCHSGVGAFTASSGPSTGSHTKHMAAAVGGTCASCHAGAIAGTTGGAAHGNTFVDVTGGYPALITKHAANSGYARCSTASCHANPYSTVGSITSPTWGIVTLCGECHTGVGAFTGASTSPTTGSHTLHQAQAAACNACHAGAVAGTSGGTAHIDGNIDVTNGYTGNVTKHAAGTYTGTCNTSLCHGAGSPTWGNNTALQTCLKCHGYRSTGWKSLTGATATNDSKVGAHFNHISSSTYKYSPTVACTVCHSGSIAGPTYTTTGHNNTASPAEALFTALASTKSVAAGGSATYNSGTGTCSLVYCHGAGMDSNVSNPPSSRIATPTWNTILMDGTAITAGNGSSTPGAGNCAKCHGFPPMTSTHALKTAAECKDCHTHVNTAGTGFINAALHVNGIVEANGDCTSCHAKVNVARMNVMLQFSTASNSHHYQGTAKISGKVCYACHWESDSLGAATAYHGKSGASVVDLVIWSTTGARPTTWSTTGTATATTYLSGGATASPRTEMQKINNHCLGCHNDANKSIQPFATDSRSPSFYSWEGKSTALGGFGAVQSIGAKYLSTVTTTWGKLTGNYTNNKLQTKAYSAHTNANNQRGWSTVAETLQGTAAVNNYPNTSGNASGANAVLCFDCHNSHGSSATPAAVTSSYDSATGVKKGGILKQTIAAQGGYTMTYTPGAAGSVAEKNQHNAGAGLCFDCHNNANASAATLSGSTTPWGYTATYGASQAIYGYNDTPYFGKSGGVFAKAITYPYLASLTNKGGHFGVSSTLSGTAPDASHQIGGSCTPCHDPHGVSPGLGTNQQFSVPLLKNTFVTSPYKQDVAPPGKTVRGAGRNYATLMSIGSTIGYHIDQNTMQAGTTGKATTVPGSAIKWAFATSAKNLQSLNSTQFAGLCMNCHSKAALNSSVAATSASGTAGSWKSSTRIHNSVAGWALTTGTGGNVGNKAHAYTCSKCHTSHNSRLPRLLVTNCLDVKHRGRAATVAYVATLYTTPGTVSTAHGVGRFPGGGGGASGRATATNPGPWFFGTSGAVTGATQTCHDTATAGGVNTTPDATGQMWNTKSLW